MVLFSSILSLIGYLGDFSIFFSHGTGKLAGVGLCLAPGLTQRRAFVSSPLSYAVYSELGCLSSCEPAVNTSPTRSQWSSWLPVWMKRRSLETDAWLIGSSGTEGVKHAKLAAVHGLVGEANESGLFDLPWAWWCPPSWTVSSPCSEWILR